MNNKLISILYGAFLCLNTYAQNNSAEARIIKFIPKNYFVLQSAEGDLNIDGINDVVLVLAKNGEDSLSTMDHPIKRKFLLLVGSSDKTYELAFQNDNVVYYYNYDPNFKDAFTDVTVNKGSFIVNHYGGFSERWSRASTFSYNTTAKKWYLTKDENSTFEATDIDNTTKSKVLTEKNFGKISFEKFDVYKTLK